MKLPPIVYNTSKQYMYMYVASAAFIHLHVRSTHHKYLHTHTKPLWLFGFVLVTAFVSTAVSMPHCKSKLCLSITTQCVSHNHDFHVHVLVVQTLKGGVLLPACPYTYMCLSTPSLAVCKAGGHSLLEDGLYQRLSSKPVCR